MDLAFRRPSPVECEAHSSGVSEKRDNKWSLYAPPSGLGRRDEDCDSAVRQLFMILTLLGPLFKPPFLGVVLDSSISAAYMPEIENKKPPSSPNAIFVIANSFEDLDIRRRLIGKQDGFLPSHTDTAQKLTEILDYDRQQEKEIIEIVIDKAPVGFRTALADIERLKLVGKS